jgi:hypothetical protein
MKNSDMSACEAPDSVKAETEFEKYRINNE